MEFKRKKIKDYDGYEIDTLGTVYSNKGKDPNRKLKPRVVSQGGYHQVSLYNGISNRPKQLLLHRLVYETFIGDIPTGLQVDHIDDDKHNNEVENLQLLTATQNMKKAWDRRGRSEIKPIIKDWLSKGYERKFIVDNLGVSHSYVSKIANGKR